MFHETLTTKLPIVLWQIYRPDFPSLKSKPFLFLLSKNYVKPSWNIFFYLKHKDKKHEKKLSYN